MRTPLILVVLTAVSLADLSIVEYKNTEEEVFQLRSKRCSLFNCEDNEDMTNSLRHVFLSSHNGLRESIAMGTEVYKKGILPKSTNMYKLNWNCGLEAQAREWTRQCDNLKADSTLKLGQNIAIIENIAGDMASAVTKTIGEWRRQVLVSDLGEDLKYNVALNIQQWANMANSATTEMGCSMHKCGTSLALTCFYNKIGDLPNNVIYKPGTPCNFDHDCTGQPKSYCVPLSGLCHQHPKKDDGEGDGGLSSYICPRNEKMTDTARHTVIDWHNAYRSNLAFGKEEDGEGVYAPMAKGMLKMHYDCILERSAQEAVERCRFAPYKVGKTGENIFMTGQHNTNHDQITLLQLATKQWWSELRQAGLGYNNTFSRRNIVNHLDHFTQMAWSSTYRVGCATNVCGEKHFAVCHYSPSGNKFGQLVYSFGSPCKLSTDCESGQVCSAEEGLCVVSLENIE